MRTFSLLLILLTPLGWAEAHQDTHSIRCVSYRLVKRSVNHHRQSSQRKEGSTTDSTMQKAVIPKGNDSLWPAFCIHHLLNDLEHCSSWDIDRKGNPKLEFAISRRVECKDYEDHNDDEERDVHSVLMYQCNCAVDDWTVDWAVDLFDLYKDQDNDDDEEEENAAGDSSLA